MPADPRERERLVEALWREAGYSPEHIERMKLRRQERPADPLQERPADPRERRGLRLLAIAIIVATFLIGVFLTLVADDAESRVKLYKREAITAVQNNLADACRQVGECVRVGSVRGRHVRRRSRVRFDLVRTVSFNAIEGGVEYRHRWRAGRIQEGGFVVVTITAYERIEIRR